MGIWKGFYSLFSLILKWTVFNSFNLRLWLILFNNLFVFEKYFSSTTYFHIFLKVFHSRSSISCKYQILVRLAFLEISASDHQTHVFFQVDIYPHFKLPDGSLGSKYIQLSFALYSSCLSSFDLLTSFCWHNWSYMDIHIGNHPDGCACRSFQ